MMNEEIAKGKWTEIKGELLRTWGKITGDELDSASGNLVAIAGLLQQRYGMAKEEASRKLDEIMARYGAKADSTLDRVKDKISRSNDRTEDQPRH